MNTAHDQLPGDNFTVSTVSTYEQSALDFLARNQIAFRCTLSDSKVAPWEATGADSRHHYRVTLSKKRREYPSRIVFDFWGSQADAAKGKHPNSYDVLACISSDAYCPESFEDFCGEYGYETDSIKAKQLFNRCHRFATKLRAFFHGDELVELAEIR